jgi:hypothetical protein
MLLASWGWTGEVDACRAGGAVPLGRQKVIENSVPHFKIYLIIYIPFSEIIIGTASDEQRLRLIFLWHFECYQSMVC